MKPAPFKYCKPESVDEVLVLLEQHGYDAKLLAGGQSLIPTMNFRLAQPAVLIDLNGIGELAYLNERPDGGLRTGAMTRQATLERSGLVAQRAPLLHETMPSIAHIQIRNRGTLGGSLAHNDPASELPAVMVALGARMRVRSRRGERWAEAADFCAGFMAANLEPDELLVEVEIPALPAHSGYAFMEVARRHGDYALVGLAATITLDESGRCQTARLVYLGVGEGPVEAQRAAAALTGEMPDEEAIEAALHLAATEDLDPPGDIHASSAYRRHLARVLGRRALTKALERRR
jgi:carbon-monoxide dehydrogenase medium subunit